MTDSAKHAALDPDTAAKLLAEEMERRLAGTPLGEEEITRRFPGREHAVRELLATLDRVEQARLKAEDELERLDLISRAAEIKLPGYELVHPVAGGGQGMVFRGRRVVGGAAVAVKFLLRTVLADEGERKRFAREAAILRQLDHPQIVKVLEFGVTADDIPYLVMPFVEGGPLRVGRLAQTMPLDDRLKLFVNIARVVQAAHDRGVIHRDLKPGNIRITADGVPHLLDFGLAACTRDLVSLQSLQTTGRGRGTPLWASPEQLRGDRDITPASDVFSLGVILHQLVTDGGLPPQVTEALRFEIEPLFDDLKPFKTRSHALSRSIRPDLRRVIQRCLLEDPAKRYQNAGELADAAEACLGYRPPHRRGTVWLAIAAIVAIVASGVAAWAPWKPVQPHFQFPESINGRQLVTVMDMGFAWIPPGEFMMGAGANDPGPPYPDERPQRLVKVERGFYMQRTEVRQSQFQRVMGYNPSKFVDPDRPVERVSYPEAEEFCRKASQITGRTIRLPTEIEWEYACRAGTNTIWFFGDNPRLFQRYGNIADRSAAEHQKIPVFMPWNDTNPGPAPSGTYGWNAWALHDTLGNVWEWCQGPYLVDPLDPASAVEGKAALRGGSWWDVPETARCAHRNPQDYGTKPSTVGFRVVMEDQPDSQ